MRKALCSGMRDGLLFFDRKAHILSLGATRRVRDESGIEATCSDETF